MKLQITLQVRASLIDEIGIVSTLEVAILMVVGMIKQIMDETTMNW
jgi:hypothetical protein